MVAKTKKFPPQRHFLAVFLFSFVWGIFGVDRMYIGKWGTGVLKLVTAGGLGIWVITDLYLIMSGKMRDAQGREFLQYKEYKKFAYKTTANFTLVVLVVVAVGGYILVQQVMSAVDTFQSGGLTELIQKYSGGSDLNEQLNQIENGN